MCWGSMGEAHYPDVNSNIRTVAYKNQNDLEEFEPLYIVVICGYEGIEDIYGVYTRSEALAKAAQLKENAYMPTDEEYENHNVDYERKHYKAEQVCIMGKSHNKNDDNEKDEDELRCCCGDFPELPCQDAWWML
jgi:hypothetical protein